MGQTLDQLYKALTEIQATIYKQLEAAYADPRNDGLEKLFKPGEYAGFDNAELRSRTYSFTFMNEPYYLYATPSVAFGCIRFDTWRITFQPSSDKPAHEALDYLTFEISQTQTEEDTGYHFRFRQDESYQHPDKIGAAYMSHFWNYIQNRDTDERSDRKP